MKTDEQNKTIIDFDSVLKKIRDESKNTAELGTRFENLTKDFFETDKLYKNRFVKVWKWMDQRGVIACATHHTGGTCVKTYKIISCR